MKRRMAFLLALVMALALAIGVMPASAATPSDGELRYVVQAGDHITIDPITSGNNKNHTFKFEIRSGHQYIHISPSGNASEDVTVYGNSVGDAVIYAYGSATGNLRFIINVSVVRSSTNLSSISSITSDSITVHTYNTSGKPYNDFTKLFVGDKFVMKASVSPSGTYLYHWDVVSDNIKIVSGENAASATFEVIAGPANTTGEHISVNVTVIGNNGSVTKPIPETYIKTIGGQLKIEFRDATTKKVLNVDTLQTTDISTNLPRVFTIPRGRSVGYTTGKVIDSSNPTTVTFDPSSNEGMSRPVTVYVRDATAWDNRPTQPDYGSMGYVVLNQYYANNPYVIMVGIEAMNNLKAMNVGATQQITADMLGGVPVNAPGMSYKVADESIADVTQSGLVRAKKAGMTMLRVFCGEHEVINKQIFVLGSGTAFEDDPIIDEDGLYFGITSVTRSLEEKGDVRFRVSAKNLSVDGEKIGHDEVEWSSSDTSVARVDDEGYVSIRKVGECYIYGTYTNEDGKEFTSRFKVVVEE